MGIRRQTLLFLGLSFLILLALQIVTSDIVVLKGFSDLDDEHARRNVVRANDELNGMLSRLSAIASDWAYWDPTYHFVKKFDETYIRKNFGAEVLINLGLNFMQFFDRSGRLVFAKSVTLPSGEEQALPEDILMRLKPERLAGNLEQSHGSMSGLLQTNYLPALVALRPVLKSDGSGPSTGTLGVGRFLDPSELRRISELADLDLSLHDLQTKPLPEALKTKANPAPEAKETIRVHRSEEGLLEGYTLLDDVFGETIKSKILEINGFKVNLDSLKLDEIRFSQEDDNITEVNTKLYSSDLQKEIVVEAQSLKNKLEESYTNVELQLLNKEKFDKPVINDIDMFFFNNVLGYDWGSNNLNSFIHTNLSNVVAIDGYGRTWFGPSGETMRMFGSERFGIVNKVSINVFKQSIQYFNETNYYKTLLTVFDLNCCMAGLDRINNKIIYTEDFLDFLESRPDSGDILRLRSHLRPAQ